MSDKAEAFLDSLLSTARALAPLVVPGAGPALAAAEKMVETIGRAKDLVGGKLPDDLEAERVAIERRVHEHVKDTAARLRG